MSSMVSNSIGKLIDKIGPLGDKGGPRTRTAIRVAMGTAVIGLAVIAFLGVHVAMTHSLTLPDMNDYLSPSYSTLGGLLVPFGLTTLGLALIVAALSNKKWESLLGTILKVALPILVVGAAGSFLALGISAGYADGGINGAILNYYTAIGAGMLVLTFPALKGWVDLFERKSAIYCR